MKDVGEKLRLHESMINQKKGILDRATFKSSMIGDMVEEVEVVDRKNWRPPKGAMASDESESEESEFTESQPA